MPDLSRPVYEPLSAEDARATATALVADSAALAALQAAIGGGGGLAIFGDGSDGDIVINGDAMSLPDPTGVTAWAPDTAYALGDRRKSTGSAVRVYRCVASGISNSDEEPFSDDEPGKGTRRGDRTEADADNGVVWEQETFIVSLVIGGFPFLANVVEGPIFANNFTIQAGRTLHCWGWAIYARGTVTIPATAILSGAADESFPEQGLAAVLPWTSGSQTLMGIASKGGNAATDGTSGEIWGGGVGGHGGSGADGAGNPAGLQTGNDMLAWTLARRSLSTMFLAMYSAKSTMGSGGGGGASDTGGGKLGGAGGMAANPLAVIAKTIVLGGSITAKGGDGQDGEAGGDTGGGGGGSGGCVVLCYNTKTGSGTVDVSGGAGGSGQGAGTDGGNAGPGDFVQFVNA